jgi:DnaJ-class molecular chaperone
MTVLKDCERCGGTGTIMVTPGGGFALNPGNRMYPEPCPTCGGVGKVKVKS